MPLSLAALRYRNVFVEDGGPIERVITSHCSILGEKQQQANAYLQPELAVGKPSHAIYGQADGTGSSVSSSIACHMAISEALERWAFLATHRSAAAARYGFDVDRSSNGMAAFPGIFRTEAARRARLEALERYAVIAWWDGRLDAEVKASPFPGVELVRIHHNAGEGEVVILVQQTRAGVCFGHAAGRTVTSAALRAAVELARADFVITAYRAKGALVQAANFLERRAVHFSTAAGYAQFQERLARRPDKPAPTWRPVFDGEICGPWSRWATVWRCAVAMPTPEYLEPTSDFFFW
jgi:ribosomal protein S12 methylthiotransferase accessory factor YcaO